MQKCGKYKHIRPKNIPENHIFTKKFKQINASNLCVVIIMDYVGSIRLYDYLFTKHSTKKIYSILLQICKINFILSEMKYSHNDLHPGNIMISPTKDKTFEIMGYQVPYLGLQLIAIDYGSMTNVSYGKQFLDDNEEYYFLDLSESLFFVLINKPKLEKNCREQKKKYPYEIKKKYEENVWKILFKDYTKIIDRYAEKYLYLYPYLRKYYIEFKSGSGSYKYNLSIFLLKIINNFALDYPEEYMRVTGWCSIPEFTLPKKDILEILECKTREEYIKLFLKKI